MLNGKGAEAVPFVMARGSFDDLPAPRVPPQKRRPETPPAPMAGDVAGNLESGTCGSSPRRGPSPKAAQVQPLKPVLLATSMKDLPSRYACYVCGVCIATSDSLLETRDDVVVFSGLHATDGHVDKAARTVCCPGCEQALGSRGDNTFVLRRDRVPRKQERLEILVCSLKQQEIAELAAMLQEAFPHSNVSPRVLLKSELRGFQLPGGQRPAPDFVVVVHRNEGRALLTDRNGFYHDVLGSAWQQTRGNVLVVLTRAEPKADADLFDQQLLRTLSTQGDQPTIGAIGALGRVLTWDTSPSVPQVKQLQLLAARAYFREPPVAAQGIPGHWSRQPPKATPSSWCSLL